MSYRFARRPRWLVLHVVVLCMVSLFAVAGLWQLHRLHERRAHNATIRRAVSGKALNLNAIDGPLRRVEAVHGRATGHYDTKREIVLQNRSLDEEAGDHVVTPLVTSDGRAILVDRGWVPPGDLKPPVDVAKPPSGKVSVDGVFFAGAEAKRPLAPDNPKTGTLHTVVRIDPQRLSGQFPYRILDGYLLVAKQTPAQHGQLPKIVPPPDLGDGPHLAYAVQWFLFIPTALAVYIALMRREAKKVSSSVSA